MQPQQDRKRDVDAVEGQLQQQAEPALAPSEHIAQDRIVHQRERRAQHADAHIGVERRVDARLGRHEPLAGQRGQRCGERQDDAGDDGDDRRPPEHRLFFDCVTAAESLGDERGRAGAQEIEAGEDHVEDNGARCQAAQQRGIAELPDDRRVDQADQRRRQIGERHRHRDRQDRPVGDVEGDAAPGRQDFVQSLLLPMYCSCRQMDRFRGSLQPFKLRVQAKPIRWFSSRPCRFRSSATPTTMRASHPATAFR